MAKKDAPATDQAVLCMLSSPAFKDLLPLPYGDKELKLKQIRQFSQGHMAVKWQRKGSNSLLLELRHLLISYFCLGDGAFMFHTLLVIRFLNV